MRDQGIAVGEGEPVPAYGAQGNPGRLSVELADWHQAAPQV
jgi:hypothetical protein